MGVNSKSLNAGRSSSDLAEVESAHYLAPGGPDLHLFELCQKKDVGVMVIM